ncbi:MAG TPA: hypothetical protein VMQ17_23895 [Candidatus Sulfotelmatobacter sp.]|nr:hypothetical protein [Candidatus Sulfotelmatobacter sp.]
MMVDFELEELDFLLPLVTENMCNKQRANGEPTPFEAGIFKKLADVRQRMMGEKFGRPKHEAQG